MPAYAPMCRIVTVYGDPLTATELLLDTGIGDAFTTPPPFDALIWPTQQLPIYGPTNPRQTRNAEVVTVTARQNDRVVITRSANPTPISAGLMFGMIAGQPVVNLGDIVHLVDTISGGTPPYSLKIQQPSGFTDTVDGLPATDWAGTAGSSQIPQSGQYHYVFSDALGKRSPNQDFFVTFGV